MFLPTRVSDITSKNQNSCDESNESTPFYFHTRRKEIEHVVGLISVNNVNLNLDEGRGTGE